jgi:hypothetical protein
LLLFLLVGLLGLLVVLRVLLRLFVLVLLLLFLLGLVGLWLFHLIRLWPVFLGYKSCGGSGLIFWQWMVVGRGKMLLIDCISLFVFGFLFGKIVYRRRVGWCLLVIDGLTLPNGPCECPLALR